MLAIDSNTHLNNEKQLATGTQNGLIFIYDLNKDDALAKLNIFSNCVYSIITLDDQSNR